MELDVAVAPAMRLDVDEVPVVLARVAEEIALPVLVERARVPIGGRTPIGATTTPRRLFETLCCCGRPGDGAFACGPDGRLLGEGGRA